MSFDLSVCTMCGKQFIYPVEWFEVDDTRWHVLTRCGNCGMWKVGIYDNETTDAFDWILEDQIDIIEEGLRREEIKRFVAALEVDAILPEDFH